MIHFCNINYTSQYCFINNEAIHINDFIRSRNIYKQKICCHKGHE